MALQLVISASMYVTANRMMMGRRGYSRRELRGVQVISFASSAF